MSTYRLLVEYDGSAFSGWQVQPDRPTVQGALRDALGVLVRGERIVPVGAGRTDAGVHAEGQVASFRSTASLDVSRLARRLTALTPDALVVREASLAAEEFHARRDARRRTYRYRFLDAPSALWRGRAWNCGRHLDAEPIRAALRSFEGCHDMTSFAASQDTSPSKVCTILGATWKPWERGWELVLVGDRFLHHMVRNVAGTLVPIGAGRRESRELEEVLAARDRRRAGVTAPPHGLTLVEVAYDPPNVAGGGPGDGGRDVW